MIFMLASMIMIFSGVGFMAKSVGLVAWVF